jgi:hypothetical protein
LNLQPDELLGAVVERLLKAMRTVRPQTVRQFFALVNLHMRWELNDLARRLDDQPAAERCEDSRRQRPAASWGTAQTAFASQKRSAGRRRRSGNSSNWYGRKG